MENRSRISSKIPIRLSRFQGPYLTALISSNSGCDVRTYSILIGLMRKNRYIFTYIRLYHESSINIMSVPSKILRSGSLVKEGDSKSVGREFEFSCRILDGQFSHWFVVTLYYLIKKIENEKDIESWGVVLWHSRQRPWFEPKHLHNLDICFCTLTKRRKNLISEATALPTEPQPLPKKHCHDKEKNYMTLALGQKWPKHFLNYFPFLPPDTLFLLL